MESGEGAGASDGSPEGTKGSSYPYLLQDVSYSPVYVELDDCSDRGP